MHRSHQAGVCSRFKRRHTHLPLLLPIDPCRPPAQHPTSRTTMRMHRIVAADTCRLLKCGERSPWWRSPSFWPTLLPVPRRHVGVALLKRTPAIGRDLLEFLQRPLGDGVSVAHSSAPVPCPRVRPPTLLRFPGFFAIRIRIRIWMPAGLGWREGVGVHRVEEAEHAFLGPDAHPYARRLPKLNFGICDSMATVHEPVRMPYQRHCLGFYETSRLLRRIRLVFAMPERRRCVLDVAIKQPPSRPQRLLPLSTLFLALHAPLFPGTPVGVGTLHLLLRHV
mmetsp:Transcript_28816/g.53969  ORF Transcript_28816/g.53969 Transcript_28816/m.53969 type:complete len:279 (+) Transcript_28816:268-1104(+)